MNDKRPYCLDGARGIRALVPVYLHIGQMMNFGAIHHAYLEATFFFLFGGFPPARPCAPDHRAVGTRNGTHFLKKQPQESRAFFGGHSRHDCKTKIQPCA